MPPPLKFWVKDREAGKVIGRGGETVREVMEKRLGWGETGNMGIFTWEYKDFDGENGDFDGENGDFDGFESGKWGFGWGKMVILPGKIGIEVGKL